MAEKPEVVGVHDGGDGVWGVTSLIGGGDGHQEHPCAQCPWRRDTPVGRFPAEVFRHSARTTYDLASEVFGCHMAGRDQPKTCAGFLLRGASDNLAIRMRLRRQDFSGVRSEVELYDDYREMAVANGVDPADCALRSCRGDRPMEYAPDSEVGLTFSVTDEEG
ncbi:DUF6283 family protein [Nonomuraea sp. NPDC050790]|uniref:DUF6283 family protein n=1 Tax=Nonomuraea sp. NPDC050790 TaxID=3364371 RepID=UPI0037BC110A